MAFQPVPGAIQVAIAGRLFNQLCVNTFSLTSGAPNTQGAVQAAADTVLQLWINNVVPLISSDYSVAAATAYSLASSDAPKATAAITPAAEGGAQVPSLPGNVALCFTHRTAARGRSGRGRLFIGGIPRSAQLNNEVEVGFATALTLAVKQVMAALPGEGFFPIVISRQNENVLRPVGVFNSIVLTELRDTALDSQRRRLLGRGN